MSPFDLGVINDLRNTVASLRATNAEQAKRIGELEKECKEREAVSNLKDKASNSVKSFAIRRERELNERITEQAAALEATAEILRSIIKESEVSFSPSKILNKIGDALRATGRSAA